MACAAGPAVAAALGTIGQPVPPPIAVPAATVAITSLNITPERPESGRLCQLHVTVANRGSRPASRFRFAVRVNGRTLPAYRRVMYFDVVQPGTSTSIRLYNFWSADGGTSTMAVEVTLAGADWVDSQVASDGVPRWSPDGRVGPLPAISRVTVRFDRNGRLAPPPAAPSLRPDPATARAAAALTFRDVTADAGITFRHERATFDTRLAHIMAWVTSIHAGACATDYDGDGDIDVYLLTARLGAPNALYRNTGAGTFVDVAAWSGVADVNTADGLSSTCLFADVDNDGWQDLLLASYGRTRLFKGSATGQFAERGAAVGLIESGNAATAVFFDYNADGWLDLFVGRYFPHDLRQLTTTAVLPESFESARNGAPDLFYRNNGDGTFTEIGARLAVNDRGWALAAAAGDLDNDGDPDLYVANDFGPDVVYRNNGDGTFADVTAEAIGPDIDAGMNAEIGDYNGDGLLDLYVTNITNAVFDQGNMLWKNLGDLRFVNLAREMNVRDGGWGWGAKFADFDNDGDLDLFAVNGFVSDGPVDIFRRPGQVARGDVSDLRSWPDMRGLSLSGHERDLLFRNDGFEYVEIGKAAGVDSIKDARGVALADFDSDGDVDLLVTVVADAPILYRNLTGRARGWLAAELAGTVSNRDAIGARITVTTGSRRQIREVDGGSGYNAQGSRIVHVGLGTASIVDEVEIRWPRGTRVRHARVPVRTKIIVSEERP